VLHIYGDNMFKVAIYKNKLRREYICQECGWKDSTTLIITISKTHSIRVSLLRVDMIEIEEISDV